MHADPRHRRRDLGREGIFESARILLCDEFKYMGSSALVLDLRFSRLRELASALGQGHRVIHDGRDATLDSELKGLFLAIAKQPTRFTPTKVHADAYDHPAPSPADTRRVALLSC